MCAWRGCPKLTQTTYCTEHARQKDRARGSKIERGYDQQYLDNRKAILAEWPSCALCGKPGANSVDHIVPGGGSDMSNLRPAHLSCNIARANRARGLAGLP